MKLRTLVTFATILMLTACGTTARYASGGYQRFDDGIYSDGPTFISKAERQAADEETEKLVEETKASEIYLFGDKKDTVMIPQNMSATIRFDQKLGTTVTVHDNPYDWRNNYSAWGWYTPFTFSIGWGFGWGYRNWHMSVHNPYYWHYGRYYDPWYYDPWYGYMGWYDPWFHDPWFHDPWYHHYCGWYGGFGYIHHSWPHHPGHMHPGHIISPGHKPGHGSGGHGGRDVRYTPRHTTGSGHIYTSGSSSRDYGNVKESGSSDRRITSGRTTVTSTTGRNLRPVTGRQTESGTAAGSSSSVNRTNSGRTDRNTTATSSGSYRRPGTSRGSSSSVNRTSPGTTDKSSSNPTSGSYRRSGTSSGSSSSSYNRNSGGFSSSSSQSRSSSSSYSRSSSGSGYSRSGSSSSGYSRSYSGGSSSGGGYSRSGSGRR